MRGVGLVLVDIGGRGVDRPDVVSGAEHAILAGSNSGAGQHHEIGLAAHDIERIIGLQRNEHRAAAALVDQVEAVIEELAEQGKPRIERGRKPFIRRDVGQMDVVAIHCDAERLEGRIAHAARSIKSSYGHRVGCDRGITGSDHRRVEGVVVERPPRPPA